MKTKFINFLKQNKAWNEFIREMSYRDELQAKRSPKILTYTHLESVFMYLDTEYASEVLFDKHFFDYKNAVTGIDWQKLSDEWEGICGNS